MEIIIYYMDGQTAIYRDVERIEKDPFEYNYTLIFHSGVEFKIPMKRVNRIHTKGVNKNDRNNTP